MTSGARVRWLGQAGFEISSPAGVKVAIDPYLGDSCMDLVGFKRMMPAPVSIEEFSADALLISHEHPDHLDIDLLRSICEKGGDMPVYGNDACRKSLEDAGLDPQRMTRIGIGDRFAVGDIEVEAVACDHGVQCVEPLGFMLRVGGVRVYFAGDTAYSPEMLKAVTEMGADVALLPINGMYGNLDSEQAVRLAMDMGCKTLIPCHFWTFVEHGGNPLWLKQYMDESPEVKVVFLAPGECFGLDWE